ncbi:MAG: bacteriohopanetetrol glucosamine biosynthesis glycosyltransferase HpnI [Bryobacterales bacterium]|nr:bacteriohopanetetrol glucosamine biosynthesis glycosyltransferase HpnI [Bryobacterales bacterium]
MVALALVAGASVYCVLTLVAVRSYLRQPVARARGVTPISVLKPLYGAEAGLESLLATFFTQEYPNYELIFAVRTGSDPAAAVVRRLSEAHPHVPSRLILTGEPEWPNAKVWSLERMTAEARFELLALCDSDIGVGPDFLRRMAGEFENPGLALTTCPYRAVPGRGLWSTLEAMGANTEFLSGVMVARLLEGMRFAVGPTIVARRQAIAAIGGWVRVKDYLAEDFMLGRLAAEAGLGVGLSRYVVDHHIGGTAMRENFTHRLRWCRSTRCSRPAGYVGQVFTNPTPLILLLLALAPHWWPVCAAAAALRAAAAWATAGPVLRDPLTARRWWLLPVQDLLSCLFWAAGFFGNTIRWRGRQYVLHPDGRFTPTTR